MDVRVKGTINTGDEEEVDVDIIPETLDGGERIVNVMIVSNVGLVSQLNLNEEGLEQLATMLNTARAGSRTIKVLTKH